MVYKYKENGYHQKVCEGRVSYGDFKAANKCRLNILNHGGNLDITTPKVEQPATFLEYVLGGCEINIHVAIDFTASNGNPNNKTSLHYYGQNTSNVYG